jgi:hypothetical protein
MTDRHSEEYKEKQRTYRQSDEYKAKQKAYRQSDAYKEKKRAYRQSDTYKQRDRARNNGDRHSDAYNEKKRVYRQTEEYKERDRARNNGDRHSTDHNSRKATSRNKFQSGFFITWDGEGVTRDDGTHDYCYFASSAGHELLQVQGTLRTVNCFELLLEASESAPMATHVIFSGSYDVNMMLIDVPKELLAVIYSGETARWGDYDISYVPKKQLTVRRLSSQRYKTIVGKDGSTSYKADYSGRVVLWDVFGFFQGSFVSALTSYNFALTDIEYIQSMKIQRGTFTADTFKRDVVPYCRKELQLLKQLMNTLKDYLIEADLTISRWDGAGAIAVALLKRYGIKQFKGVIPDAVNKASLYAYSGGRIECIQYGHYEGTVYHYDLNSAYPSAMLRCPDLSTGEWVAHKKTSPDMLWDHVRRNEFSLWDVEWSFPDDRVLYPFAMRDLFGQIAYPASGRSWIWGPELNALFDASPDLAPFLIIRGGYSYETDVPKYPFDFLPELFALRARWKREGNGAEKVLKLGINSLYGKMIQKQGYREKEGVKGIPPYFQLQWAGFITSATRASLYRASMQAPQHIICLATDGIFSTVPLDLPLSKRLGEWDDSIHTSMTIVQSGVYWYTNLDGSRREYYRGFDRGTITEEKVLDAWRAHVHTLEVKTTRFITLGSALVSEDRFKLWRHWHTIDRVLTLDFSASAKRCDTTTMKTRMDASRDSRLDRIWDRGNPAEHMYMTRARPDAMGFSAPYKLPWEEQYTDVLDGCPAYVFLAECADSYA